MKIRALGLLDSRWHGLLAFVGLFCALQRTAAQGPNLTTSASTNGTLQIAFPGNLNSYYFLLSSSNLAAGPPFQNSNLTAYFGPVGAVLGAAGAQAFSVPVHPDTNAFFMVSQYPVTGNNSLFQDGIPDIWKLTNHLNAVDPNLAQESVPGTTLAWGQLYRQQTNQAALPLAYFPVPSSTVLVGSTNVSVPVAFTKPFTGQLTYQLSGTAIPSSAGVAGDYLQPAGSVFCNNATNATISIRLVPEPDIEINRAIVLALSAPPLTNQAYTITTNSSVATVQIVQSAQGVYVGALTMASGPLVGSQSVKMALRPGAGGGAVAFFDVTGNALLGNTFTVPVSASATGFQLGGGAFNNLVTNTPWGRTLGVELSFGSTETNGASFTTPVTLSLGGLTSSGVSYPGSGILNLTRSQ